MVHPSGLYIDQAGGRAYAGESDSAIGAKAQARRLGPRITILDLKGHPLEGSCQRVHFPYTQFSCVVSAPAYRIAHTWSANAYAPWFSFPCVSPSCLGPHQSPIRIKAMGGKQKTLPLPAPGHSVAPANRRCQAMSKQCRAQWRWLSRRVQPRDGL